MALMPGCAAILALAAIASAAAGRGPAVDQYGVVFGSPSGSSLGAMPLGNGRTSANVWVEASTGDLVLLLGLADALDENSNLLKLGIVRVRLEPRLDTATDFNQTLVRLRPMPVRSMRHEGSAPRPATTTPTATCQARPPRSTCLSTHHQCYMSDALCPLCQTGPLPNLAIVQF